ncbi:pyridoxamine 5'-phosphate oxidase family protein [Anaerostipes sp.]|uniref:pyridoxamine 5'-phosphate oxidase family protein n=1 Tax=Anaerostipes sp. TaxID=1872530 RepID=UPI0025C60574|nr:pyridoxamine 5'-phosphate oxidase family protein [Anaerostipes sp.]MBS7006831.1 pyridoxamine 5'-phosphate oxidase family protein [Anaerostipes sp.]
MRKKDREVLNEEKIDKIISDCYCCRLGLQDEGRIYIVPLSFGYEKENSRRIFYFHSAKEGRKIDLIRKNGYAGFELDTNYTLKEGVNACSYSAAFQSVTGSGKMLFVNEPEEKKKALSLIMHHNTGKEEWEFSEEMLEAVCVFKLEAEELSCKENL